MNTKQVYSSPLRQQQQEDTRRRIVEAALGAIAEKPEGDFTHEELAKRAGIALRTVYRHFPSRAELLDAVWQESDRRLDLSHYPDTEEGLLASLGPVFGEMDLNASLMRGLLNSNAGREMRQRDSLRRRQGVVKALAHATQHLGTTERKRVVAVFQALYGGRTWEMMRDRAELEQGEVSLALEWAMRTLLDSLYRDQARLKREEERRGNGIQAATAKNSKSTTRKEKK